MIPGICSYEKAVAEAVRQGDCAGIADPALRSHVKTCPRCSDLVLVVQSLQQVRNETLESAPMPPPGLLWWRAQIRRRSGAVELVSRPIALVEKLALVLLAAGVLCLAVWQWDQIAGWTLIPANPAHLNAFMVETLRTPVAGSAGWIPTLVVAGLFTLALFGAMAIYLLVEKE